MELDKIKDSLSPNEKRIIPFIKENDLDEISKKSNLDKVAVLRALEFLSNKELVILKTENKKIVELDVNGILYLKKGLPERNLMNFLSEKKTISINEAKKSIKLNENEFKAALGALKKRAFINLVNGNIVYTGNKEGANKTLEEKFLESLPKDLKDLKPEEKFAFENLKNRKNIISVKDKKKINILLTKKGEEIEKEKFENNLIESLTPKIIKNNSWKGKKFRRYDIKSKVPKIYGGKRHFVNQATDYAKKIWLEMGFKEMTGNLVISSFWNFDALFTAQDHPVREMQDTFFINKDIELPEKNIILNVKKAHEGKISNSKGWQYQWDKEISKKALLRTHTTCLSVQTLKKIKEKNEFPAKYFALGKCFRNETVDWSHNFEFNQTEGIVVDENANFKQLLGYLKEFFNKMGYEKIRIRPGYFPYTEPSLEIDIFHPKHKKWVEFGGAGMFRPEVTIPIFGKHIPVLAWGPGFDRIIMEFFNIEDLREMYKNNLTKLRNLKIWDK